MGSSATATGRLDTFDILRQCEYRKLQLQQLQLDNLADIMQLSAVLQAIEAVPVNLAKSKVAADVVDQVVTKRSDCNG